MMPEVHGTPLANPGPSDFVQEQDLDQHLDNIPPSILRRDPMGQDYFTIITTSDDNARRWLYLPIKREHLRPLLTGEITVLTAVKKAHQFLIVDQAADTGAYIRTVMIEKTNLRNNKTIFKSLPEPHIRLNIPSWAIDAWERHPALAA